MLLLHDTGGTGASWFENTEQLLCVRDLVAAGYGVVALDSVNRITGAWSAQTTLARNPDAATFAAALDRLIAAGAITDATPVFLLGYANGADSAARFADLLATGAPPRPIRGVIAFCATGGATFAVTSRVPLLFALAANDNGIGATGNAEARDNAGLLAGRGVATAVVSNGPAPVYPARFRKLGLTATSFSAADAETVWNAVKSAGALDENNYVRALPSETALRAMLPTAQQARTAEVAAQLAVAYGAREFYSDADAQLIAFLDRRIAGLPAPAPGRIMNLSTRSHIAFLGDAFPLGFTLTGPERATLLIRGIGPALARFGFANPLMAPRLEVYRGNTLIAANEGWDRAADSAAIASAATSVGAFALARNSLDTAVLLTLEPGTYTATVKALGGTVGDILAEVYDVSQNATRLTNLSALARITSDNDFVAPGIVIAGGTPRTLLVRAVGPSLPDTVMAADAMLPDPRVVVLNAAGQTVASNSNWTQASTAALVAAFPAVGAFPLRSANDAALIHAFTPGSYTLQTSATPLTTIDPSTGQAIVRTADTSTGSVLVEVYELP